MTSIPAYTFNELQEAAKFEADKGAMLYAAQSLLASAESCPAQAVAQMHQVARKEWLDGFFDATGTMRFPPSLFKVAVVAPAAPAVGGPNDGA